VHRDLPVGAAYAVSRILEAATRSNQPPRVSGFTPAAALELLGRMRARAAPRSSHSVHRSDASG
jgi:hypothetical protein